MATRTVVKTTVTKRTFKYELEGCTLEFTLRTDNTRELVPYVELLKQGLEDVKEEIDRIQTTIKSKK